MRLLDLFTRSRPRSAPRPYTNRVRCAVERLEDRLVLSTIDSTSPPPVVTQPPPTTPIVAPVMPTGTTPSMT
jgi:hypothetical protein